ncbi:uncharacterized protein il17rc [Symphorus nematophorus]
MFLPGWSIWCVLLTLPVSVCGLEISEYDSDEVICSQGLSDCTMTDEMPLTVAGDDAVRVKNMMPYFNLCCKDREPCTLCLVIDTEIKILSYTDVENEGSGLDEEDYSEETRSPKASVTVCYNTPPTIPTCKKVEFTVNHTALTQQNQTKLSMVIDPVRVFFNDRVFVRFYSKPSCLHREVYVPSLEDVCSQEMRERVEDCHVPRLRSVINQEMNHVELQFADSNESLPSVCVQYEENGICQRLNGTTIPLYSVTPCMCLQAWYEDDQISTRSPSCPFTNTDLLQRNVWQNVSVSVVQGQMSNNISMLWWNLSAPCRLQGEVWPCHRVISCTEIKGFRQQLANDTWKQNSKEHWEQIGVFEDINLHLSPCVMVKIHGMGYELGPFCFNNTDRGRWSLLVIGVLLLVCLTMLIFYLLHDFVKKWVWSWHHGGFVKIGRRPHVVLLSPPDVDDGVSESVCQLGSLLCNQGFSVSVDQWSRKEQCTLGPLPWLHSQLLGLNSQSGRVVLVLTREALKRAEEWTHQHKEVIKTKGEDKGLPQIGSPYSDVFMASLCLIQADQQLGRAGERFLLVTFDLHSDRSLPDLLQGLLLFQLPSQTQAFLTELSVGGTGRGSSRSTWTWWRAKTKEVPDQQKALHCKSVGDKKNLETVEALRHPLMSC